MMDQATRQADRLAAKCAVKARQLAKTSGLDILEAFTAEMRFLPDEVRKLIESPPYATFPNGFPGRLIRSYSEDSDPNCRNHFLFKSRFDVEALLLRIDTWSSSPRDAIPAAEWSAKGVLTRLHPLIDEAARLLGSRPPPTRWERCQRIDRHFPKLRLCRRVVTFVDRLVEVIPPRRLGTLLPSPGQKDRPFREEFFDLWRAARTKGLDPATVDWSPYLSLLIDYQNAERRRTGKVELRVLHRAARIASVPSILEPYVAFLEMDREDLLWVDRHSAQTHSLEFWVKRFEDTTLLGKLRPYRGAMLDYSFDWIAEERAEAKRSRDCLRKARSRKKIRGNV